MWHYEYLELFNSAGQVRENLHTYNYIKKRQMNGGLLSKNEAKYLVEMEKRIRENPNFYNQFLELPFSESNNQSTYSVDSDFEDEEDDYNNNYYEEENDCDDYYNRDLYDDEEDDEKDKDDILDDLLWLAILEEDDSL